MVTVDELKEVVDHANDFNARVIILIFLILVHIYIWFKVDGKEPEQDWEIIRNFFLRIWTIVFMTLTVFFVPIMLQPGYSVELLLQQILSFLNLVIIVAGMLTFIWFYDKFRELFKDAKIFKLPRFFGGLKRR